MLRFIYKRYRKQFQDLLIEDIFDAMPDKLSKPALEVLGAKRENLLRWLYFEANAVSRRNPTDFGNLERRNGILIMIQAMILLVSTVEAKTEEHPVLGDIKKVPDDWKKGVESFKNAKKKISTGS